MCAVWCDPHSYLLGEGGRRRSPAGSYKLGENPPHPLSSSSLSARILTFDNKNISGLHSSLISSFVCPVIVGCKLSFMFHRKNASSFSKLGIALWKIRFCMMGGVIKQFKRYWGGVGGGVVAREQWMGGNVLICRRSSSRWGGEDWLLTRELGKEEKKESGKEEEKEKERGEEEKKEWGKEEEKEEREVKAKREGKGVEDDIP